MVCCLWVEVIEDSIHAVGTFCSWTTLTYSSLSLSPSWGELLSPGGAIAFCASDFGGGMTEALGGSLLSNVKQEITNTKWFCSPSLFSTVGVLVWLVSQLKHEILNLRILRAG